MNGIEIYMEGGGKGRDTRVALRNGMNTFLAELRETARKKRWKWSLECCGSRNDTFSAFLDALNHTDESYVVLLVDSEGAAHRSPRDHLEARDGWCLTGVDADAVHLMTQAMESWIVADPDSLARFYRQGFNRNALPRTEDLETVSKTVIASALAKATAKTQKGKYHKTQHASYLLKCIDPRKARQK